MNAGQRVENVGGRRLDTLWATLRKTDAQTLWRFVPFGTGLLLGLWLLADSCLLPLPGPIFFLSLLPAVLLAGLAAILLVVRRHDPSVCLLAIYLLMLAVLARDNTAGLTGLPTFGAELPDHSRAPHRLIHIVWALAFGAAPLLFAWTYTEDDRIARTRLVRYLMLGGLIGSAVVGQAACVFFALRGAYGLNALTARVETLDSPYHRMLLYSAPMLLSQQIAACWLLIQHYRRWGEGRNGALALFFGFTLLFVVSILLNDALTWLTTCVMTNLVAYLVPLLLVYAIERHTLFDIRIHIRRVVQYALARSVLTVMTVAPLVGLAYLLGLGQSSAAVAPNALPSLHRTLLINGSLVCGILGGTFALMLALRAPLLRWFDRTYFREVYDAQRVLGNVGRSLIGLTDLREIAQAALEGIDSVLHPVSAMLLSEEGESVICLARRNYTGYHPPLWPDRSLLSLNHVCHITPLHKGRTPQDAWIETLPASASALLKDADCRLLIPLKAADRTTGVLLLGEKASGLGYLPEDVEVLRALASQIALALQSARLNREFLRRGTHELTVRSVGFVELVEQERRLLAADLHDQTLPELRCLLTDLEALAERERSAEKEPPPTTSRPSAAEMAENIRQTIQNIRDIMESLRPSALEMLGLLPALENELRKAASRARPRLVPQFQAPTDTRPEGLSAFAEMSVFRIVQEAVNNACRHAGARTVRVQMDVEDGEWVVRVDDDGIGLPTELAPRQGGGLDNMQYRAGLIEARIAWSVPEWGRGTRVELRLPLQPGE